MILQKTLKFKIHAHTHIDIHRHSTHARTHAGRQKRTWLRSYNISVLFLLFSNNLIDSHIIMSLEKLIDSIIDSIT